MPLVPKAWMPACSMKRVVLHWTAGAYQPSGDDKAHYHILIDGDRGLHRGTRSIADNVSTADGIYAAHTRKLNTGSIGVTCCAMAAAKEAPYEPGSAPMTEGQWTRMAEVTADLCRFYKIPVTPKTVVGHGEVPTHLGIDQGGKWDPMVLPWNRGLTRTQVGNFFRSVVENLLEGSPAMQETPAAATVRISGQKFDGFLSNGDSYVILGPPAEAFGWTVESVADGQARVRIGAKTHSVPSEILGERGYVACGALATALGLGISWNGPSRTVTIA